MSLSSEFQSLMIAHGITHIQAFFLKDGKPGAIIHPVPQKVNQQQAFSYSLAHILAVDPPEGINYHLPVLKSAFLLYEQMQEQDNIETIPHQLTRAIQTHLRNN